jgi:hypothetical protein
LTSKILSLLALDKVLPSSSIVKGISKNSPFLKKFFSKSAEAGIGRGAALAFLSTHFGGSKVEPEEGERPDETAQRMERRERDMPLRVAKDVTQIGALAGVGGMLSGLGKDSEPQEDEQMPQQEPLEAPQEPKTFSRTQSMALDEITSLKDLARIDDIVAKKVVEGLQKGLSPNEIEVALKRSKILGGRTMMVERKLGKPISWIINYIQERPSDMQTSPRQPKEDGIDSLLKSAMDILGGR